MRKKSSVVDPDEAPRLTGEELRRPGGRWRSGGKEMTPEEGKAAFRKALGVRKVRTNIHLDSDVIAHFKTLAGDRGYQTLINAALRRDMEGLKLKEELMLAIRSELFEPMKAELVSVIDERFEKRNEQPINFGLNAYGIPIATLSSLVTGTGVFVETRTIKLGGQTGVSDLIFVDDPQSSLTTAANSEGRIFESTSTMGTA